MRQVERTEPCREPIEGSQLITTQRNCSMMTGLPTVVTMLLAILLLFLAIARWRYNGWGALVWLASFVVMRAIRTAQSLRNRTNAVWRSHPDLGRNWSPGLEVREDQALITSGVYGRGRNPIYAVIGISAPAQPFLVHNGIAGFLLIPALAAVWFVRVANEEALMRARFGDACDAYGAHASPTLPARHAIDQYLSTGALCNGRRSSQV